MRVNLIFILLFGSLFSNEEIAIADPPAQVVETSVEFAQAPAPKTVETRPALTSTEGYTINYNTVSIIEYIRFASKICKVNFIYDEADLNFTVTVVSDEPVTPANVMATLIQVLRVHGCMLLEQDNNLVIHKSADVRQVANLVTDASQENNSPIVTRIFRLKNAKPESIAAVVQPMISSTALLEISAETKQLILTDITANVDKIAALIENLDSPHTLLEIKSFNAQHNKPDFLIELAGQIMNPIAQGNPFILVPQNLANEVFIVSTPELVDRALAVFTSLDSIPKVEATPQKPAKPENVFVYKVMNRSGDDVLKGLTNIAQNLQSTAAADPNLIQTIDTAKWIRETNSLMFIGNSDSLDKVKQLLAALDVSGSGQPTPEKTSFFVYKPVYRSAEEIQKAIVEMANNLKGTSGATPSLIDTINSVKINPLTHTLSFSGEEKNFSRIQELLATIDSSSGKVSAPTMPPSTQFLIYKPINQSGEQLLSEMKETTAQLKADKLADPALLNALGTMKWVKATNSLMFTGDPASLQKIQTMIGNFDAQSETKPGYYIYKVQNTTGDLIEEDLDNVAKNFKSSGLKDTKILDVIGKMRYVKQTNSLLLTGDPKAIDEVKALIAQYDYPRAAGPTSSNFFMYKPQNLPAGQVEKSLKEVETNLKNAGLADPSLLKTIDNVKYVESTNSLVFTGPPDALSKVQTLIKDIDVPPKTHAPIQHVGKTTFLLYKLKNASGPTIVASLKNMAAELKRTSTSDKDLLAALNSVKYVKETNSLFFSGTEEALGKVQTLVEQFDVTGLAAKPETPPPTTGPSNFFVYKPQSLAGPDIEKLLEDFGENLKSSGLNDPELFSAISSTRWTDKTQTLIFTGTPKALDQIKELLNQFDIPSNLPSGPTLGSGPESSIQAIDNTSFLVYKLQFHKGDEIQGALRQIAKDLILSNAPVNQGLLNSINSIQWLEVTNSLLSSGDQETLTRLRELIKNLDIPLKQVFIEMLVMETTMFNSLSLGLEWGGSYNYRNKFGVGSYNSLPFGGTNSSGTPSTFLTNLQKLAPPAHPSPTNILPSSGFDLGVIGEVIRFKGNTYLTLGSLLTALQLDTDTNVIMTPKIIAQDGRTSSLFDGSNIPFVGSFVQNNASNTVNTSNLEYRDIGFSLTVTPVLGNSDIVTLDIAIDSSSVVGTPTGAINFTASSAQGITSKKTTMQTTVHVPDNNFLVLSGMVNNSNVKIKSAIPCLGGLPLVGAFFTQNSDTVSNDNIVIFIRPRIINSAEDLRRITTQEEDYFRDQAGTPFLEHRFDEGMELIKTVDDE